MSRSRSMFRIGTALLVSGLWSSASAQCLPDKLTASDGTPDDQFGQSAAASGDSIIVGAPYEDGWGLNSGAVYFFEKTRDWDQIDKLNASDGAAGDFFGQSVSLSGDTAIAQAIDSVYVFERMAGIWTEVAKLDAPGSGGLSAASVSMDGDTALVGAGSSDISEYAVYVLEKVGGEWTQVATLTPDGQPPFVWGVSVCLDGERAIVGEIYPSVSHAYIFERVGDTWTQVAILSDPTGDPYGFFGWSVAISGDTALVAAPQEEIPNHAGATYVFERVGGVWTHAATLTAADGASGDLFGSSACLDGDTALVGAEGDEDFGPNSGSAYVFERSGGVWTQVVKRTAPDGSAGAAFARSASLDGDTALVGAVGNESAYAFDLACSCPPDFNEDYLIDTRDLLAFLNAWASGDTRADWDQNGTIDTQDVLAFLNDWAGGC